MTRNAEISTVKFDESTRQFLLRLNGRTAAIGSISTKLLCPLKELVKENVDF